MPVETRGAAERTLVFLPGLGVHPRYYRRGLDRLARSLTVMVPDLSFRSHRRLPATVEDYLDAVSTLEPRVPADAVWSGHSFGGLLAMLRPGPAIACAPSIPSRTPFPTVVARAAWLQLREYTGREGPHGMAYAGRILLDYLRAAILRPRSLFPVVAALHRSPEGFPVVATPCRVFLCERDEMYSRREYAGWLDRQRGAGIEVEYVRDGHDWPITRPRRFEERMTRAFEELTDVTADAARTTP